MMLKIFSVYDTKSETYARPFYETTNNTALRSFSDIAKDKQHPIGAHPADYHLFALGEFNDQNATFTPFNAPINLGCAIEFVQPDLKAVQNG